MTTNLSDFKLKKKYERYVKDIGDILKVFNLTQKALSVFKNYIAVQEIISILETNGTLLDLKRKKYEKELEIIKAEYTQQNSDQT
jgi:hypothetical protein